jgi:hypothetical protein
VLDVGAEGLGIDPRERRLARVVGVGRVERVEHRTSAPGALGERVRTVADLARQGWGHDRLVQVQRPEGPRPADLGQQQRRAPHRVPGRRERSMDGATGRYELVHDGIDDGRHVVGVPIP